MSEQLTEKDFLSALPPRHKDCNCPLCEMDKRVVESARESLFGKKTTSHLDVVATTGCKASVETLQPCRSK